MQVRRVVPAVLAVHGLEEEHKADGRQGQAAQPAHGDAGLGDDSAFVVVAGELGSHRGIWDEVQGQEGAQYDCRAQQPEE